MSDRVFRWPARRFAEEHSGRTQATSSTGAPRATTASSARRMGWSCPSSSTASPPPPAI
ncbi:hypothetical protein AB5I41_07630 [Sphingomonas sp. MMS24-JH45]